MSEVMCASSTMCNNRSQADHSPEFHVKHKPSGVQKTKRRGLSKFYTSKSQSFSSLELALTTAYGESALGLAKRPSSQDLVNAVRALTHTTSTLEPDTYIHSNSMDTQCCLSQPHCNALTFSGREGSMQSMPSSGSGPTRSSAESLMPESVSQSFCNSSQLNDFLLPSWLHRTTDELCAALHNASLQREHPGTRSPTSGGQAGLGIGQHYCLHTGSPPGTSTWAAGGHLLSVGRRDHC